jgi:sugar O-acyltransferase (sialic acid O-acetyltransferase NeuD family)
VALTKVVILGAGGYARELSGVFDAVNALDPRYEVLGYLVDAGYGTPGTLVDERPILGDIGWLAGRTDDVQVIAAVGAPALRRKKVAAAATHGARFVTVVHPTVVLPARVSLGVGVALAAGSMFTTNIRVGDHAHVNLGCTVGHDSRIEPFAMVSPGVHVSGNVVIEEGCLIGTGASIIEGRRIGAWAIVGAGSAVIVDVPANTTVVGVPARVMITRDPGWHLA